MKRIVIALLATGILFGFGCVITTKHTIEAHIVVDIRHIEEQAENVLDYVEGKTETPPVSEEKKAPSSGWLDRTFRLLAPMPVAYAAELKSSSTLITQIADKLKERFPKLDALKSEGLVGEDNRGYVSLRNETKLTDPKRKNEVQQLVAAENADRKALYREVARLNEDRKVTMSMVERVYAQKRLERAKPGEIFQLPPKGEDFDEFKTSELGKKLGGECVPDAWATIK